jgi:hypothetical protein
VSLRRACAWTAVLAASMLSACIGGNKGTATNSVAPTPTVNTLALIVDSGPTAATGQVNHAYVTVRVCVPGSTTQCTNVDHVLLDTGSWGLRLVRSVLAAGAVTLSAETDAQSQSIEECLTLGGGQLWGPVALADVTLAGEVAAKLPVQVIDDTSASAPPPATCGANGTLLNSVSALGANGVLGAGVFAQDCGTQCVSPATPLPIYYGCTAAGACSAENIAVTAQVTNPVAMFAADNNGIIIDLPNLQNANGDVSVQGQVTFGLGTQTDNALPATGLTVLGADANGDFTATYNGSTTVLPALIDSGTDSYAFSDPSIAVCDATVPFAGISFVGYYCPATAPLSLSAVNTGVGTQNNSNTVQFALDDPHTFVPNAAAFVNLGQGGGLTTFTWGMPFFYGRKIYIGIDQKVSGSFTGPYYAY